MDASISSTLETQTPQEDEPKMPELGTIFPDLEATFNFYNSYEKKTGLSVRKGSNKFRNGEIIWKQYVCFKQGRPDEKVEASNAVRRRSETREGCNAELQVRKIGGDQCMVSKFVS